VEQREDQKKQHIKKRRNKCHRRERTRPATDAMKSHHSPSTPKHHIPSNIFKKKHDTDAVAQTNPKVSLDMRRGVGEEEHPMPFMKAGRYAGITTSVPDMPTRISPDHQTNHPRRSEVFHLTYQPPADAATVLEPFSTSHCGHRCRA
jgi:hypothetical protein